jgi:hypothetical protein
MHYEPDGVVTYDDWDPELTSGTFSPVTTLAKNVARFSGPAGRNFTTLSPSRLVLFRRLIQSAHDSGASVHIFIPPLHRALVAARAGLISQRSAELERWFEELDREGLIHFMPLHGVEDFGGDPDAYYDGVHMMTDNTDRLLLKLFGRPHGCGV